MAGKNTEDFEEGLVRHNKGQEKWRENENELHGLFLEHSDDLIRKLEFQTDNVDGSQLEPHIIKARELLKSDLNAYGETTRGESNTPIGATVLMAQTLSKLRLAIILQEPYSYEESIKTYSDYELMLGIALRNSEELSTYYYNGSENLSSAETDSEQSKIYTVLQSSAVESQVFQHVAIGNGRGLNFIGTYSPYANFRQIYDRAYELVTGEDSGQDVFTTCSNSIKSVLSKINVNSNS